MFGFGGCNAHLLLEAYSSRSEQAVSTPAISAQETKPTVTAPLKITGLASHFGSLKTINALNHAIETGADAFVALPKKRWKGLDQHPELLSQFGLHTVPHGAYIDHFELDFLRFKVPPNEDDRLISQQLLLMKVADEAIRDAKLETGQKVAVLVAMETELEMHQFRGRVNLHTQLADSLDNMGITLTDSEYQSLEAIAMDSVLDAAKLNQYTSFIGNIMASRIASLWDFNGPAFTISAAEQSVARCIDVAQNLMAQESLDAVVIAAVDLSGSAEQVILKNSITPVASTAQDSGWHVGEGAGAIVLVDAQEVAASNSYGTINALAFSSVDQSQSATNRLLNEAGIAADNISLLELNQAPESTDVMAFPLSRAAQTQASRRMGHCYAASGMSSTLHGLLSLNQATTHAERKAAIVANISEGQCSQLLVTQTSTENQSLTARLGSELPADSTRQLIKQVTLGGRDIYQHIVTTDLPELSQIQQKSRLRETACTSRS